MRTLGAVVVALLLLSAAPALAAGDRDGRADRIVVAFEPGARAADRTDALDDVDAASARALPALDHTQAVTVPDGHAAAAVAELNRDGAVAWAQVDRPARIAMALPSGDYSRGPWQWGLQNDGQWISGPGVAGVDGDFPSAWETTPGTADVPIAVVDTGVDFTIDDLAANRTLGGHDFVSADDDPSPTDADPAAPTKTSHGTHVAGTAAAALGVNQPDGDITGAAPTAGIMALRALDATGSGWTSDIAAAFAWAAEHGVRVVNASLSSVGPSQAMADAITKHPNTLFVVAAGNGDDDGVGIDEDAQSANDRDYPCAMDAPNVVCVAAVDNRGQLAEFSNYGAASVDVGAPGVNVVSYTAGGSLAWWSGTSMATPYVAAAAELAVAARPSLTAPQLHDAIVASARPLEDLAGRTSSGGMVDAAALVELTATLPEVAAPLPPATTSEKAIVASPPPSRPLPVAPTPTPAPTPVPPQVDPVPAAPPQPSLRSPGLQLSSASRSGKRLKVSGRTTTAWTGTVTISVCAKGRCTTTRASVRKGKFSVTLKPKSHGTVTVTAAVAARGAYGAAQATRSARA